MMSVIINIFAVVFSFLFMEFAAWFTHKYIMHGLLWKLHKDHHVKSGKSFFEMNDLFFIFFATPSILLMYLGYNETFSSPLFWAGVGIALYGMAYTFVHDIYIHQRFKFFTKFETPYFRSMRRAHKMHHKHTQKEDGESFGFLYVEKIYRTSK